MKKEHSHLSIKTKEAEKLLEDARQLVLTYPTVPVTVDCVIFGFEENELKVLLIKSDLGLFRNEYSLLGDFMTDREELDDAAYRILKERTGMTDVYLEQVKTFSNPDRHPGGRVLTVAYCSLLNINHHSLNILDNELHWHNYTEIKKMAFDHKEIMDTCHKWLQKKIQEYPIAFSLLPEKFSLTQLQNVYETILSIKLDRRNFRKKFATMGLLVDLNEMEKDVPHRPGKLYKFNFDKYRKHKRTWTGIDFF